MSHNDNIKATIKTVSKKFSKELGLIGTFFLLTVTISNVVYRICGFTLIPIVQTTFDAFRNFCHFVLHLFVFSWLVKFLKIIWYGITYLGSLFLPIIPDWPEIIIPRIVADLALLSLALTRVFQNADYIVPRSERAIAEKNMMLRDWNDIKKAEGPFWSTIHQVVESINNKIWRTINVVHSFLTYPIRNCSKIIIIVRGILISLAGIILMWGYIRIIGYSINVLTARKLSSPIMIVRKKFFRYFVLSLIGAILATALFIVLNGWLADWTAPTHSVTK